MDIHQFYFSKFIDVTLSLFLDTINCKIHIFKVYSRKFQDDFLFNFFQLKFDKKCTIREYDFIIHVLLVFLSPL